MIWKLKFIFIVLIVFPLSCASVISEEIRNKANDSLLFSQVQQKPDAYKGQTVVWGGEIIKTETLQDKTTLIEVYQRPLGMRDAPDINSESDGRFIVSSKMFLDPYNYKTGKKITVGGVIEGEEVRPIGQMDYHYPVIISKEIYLWDDSYYRPPDPGPVFVPFYIWPYPTHRHGHHH